MAPKAPSYSVNVFMKNDRCCGPYHNNICHKSTRSIKIKLNADNKANFNPLVLKAKAMKIRITIGNGMKLNNVSKA